MHTSTKHIEKLLEKYLEGQSTLEEEAQLKNYFTSDSVAPHLNEYKAMFGYFVSNKKVAYEKELPAVSQLKSINWLGYGAGLALLIGFVGMFRYYQQKRTALKAYEETRFALALIAEQMQKGNEAIIQLSAFEETTNKVFKQKIEK